MKSTLTLALNLSALCAFAQPDILPMGLSREEKLMQDWYLFVPPDQKSQMVASPPPYPVRHMAEWEELQALCITWRTSPAYIPATLTQIVKHASLEVPVFIFCNSQNIANQAASALNNAGVSPGNVQLLLVPNNSVWIRDYGPNCVYANEVEDLNFIDWIYNRPTRPLDDLLPDSASFFFDVPVFNTTQSPYDLVHTGGNFMSDGLGTAFSSGLILEENGSGPQNIYGVGPHTSEEIDEVLSSFMGIERFIKMEVLPYDGIHHIDMHMKLLDEETLLVCQYPQGVADGPKIEENIQYILSNYQSPFGSPYKIVRIVQPPDSQGDYPDQDGEYRTYTNSVFVNKTILVPAYEEKYDTTAFRIYRENFPGYKVVGINCDDIIQLSGALHCITKEVGVKDPLWIVHQRHPDVPDNSQHFDYPVTATIKHRDGIANAWLYYTTDTLAGYSHSAMMLADSANSVFSAAIPHQPDGSRVFYYIKAQANSGKVQHRPLPAPSGFYHFKVTDEAVVGTLAQDMPVSIRKLYPNPAGSMVSIPVYARQQTPISLELLDVLGLRLESIFSGNCPEGESLFRFNTGHIKSGTYLVVLRSPAGMQAQRLVVR